MGTKSSIERIKLCLVLGTVKWRVTRSGYQVDVNLFGYH